MHAYIDYQPLSDIQAYEIQLEIRQLSTNACVYGIHKLL